MAVQAFLSGVSSATTIAALGTVDDAVVGAQATLISAGSAIVGSGSNHSVTVFGAVYGAIAAVRLGSVGTFDNTVQISSGGQIAASGTGISLVGKVAEVINSGSIISDNWGVYGTMDGDGLTYVTNHGTITASSCIGLSGSSLAIIENFGRLEATNQALSASGDIEVRLVNHGTIIGDIGLGVLGDTITSTGLFSGTIHTNEGDDRVTIAGDFHGSIRLGDGDDNYEGTFATAAALSVYGDAGNDSFSLGNAAETIGGGLGEDWISYSSSRKAVQVYLDEFVGYGGGAADGDLYFEIENVSGGRGNDKLFGWNEANRLTGNRGNDVLSGGAGDDTLQGDQGDDRMTGGLGNDTFFFWSLKGGADTITDFHNVAGDNDVITINALSFGGGLVAGSLAPSQFRSRIDNVAQDSDDRFIFNTTDKTLWFDEDGNGTAAAVLVVDLQNGANLTFADIVLL